jgi:hypothetical protein
MQDQNRQLMCSASRSMETVMNNRHQSRHNIHRPLSLKTNADRRNVVGIYIVHVLHVDYLLCSQEL